MHALSASQAPSVARTLASNNRASNNFALLLRKRGLHSKHSPACVLPQTQREVKPATHLGLHLSKQ